MQEVYQVVLRGRLFGTVETRNVFYVRTGDAYPAQQVMIDMGAWLTAMWTPMLGLLSNLWHSYQVDLSKRVQGTPGWVPVLQFALGIQGASSGDMLPSQMAAVWVAKTLVRKTFSRKFIAGVTEAQSNSTQLITSAISDLADAMSVWIAGYEAQSVSYESGLWAKNNTFVPLFQGTVDAIMGTMRRRKQGVGV